MEPTTDLNISREGTNVYFSEEISAKSTLNLRGELLAARDEAVEIMMRMFKDQYLHPELTSQLSITLQPEITLYINSYGGDVESAFAVADFIMGLHIPVHTVISGVACSAATLISLAGARRSIARNSVILIHQHSTWFFGTYDKLKDSKYWDDDLYRRMVKFYNKRTLLSKKEIKRRLKHDWYMNAKQAVKDGFVERILK